MDRLRKLSMIGATALAVVGGSVPVDAATALTIGADEGRRPNINPAALTGSPPGCAMFPLDLTPTVGCCETSPNVPPGNFGWQIPLPTPAATSSATTLSANAVAKSGMPRLAPFDLVTGRLLAWNKSGVLVCATSGPTWSGGTTQTLPIGTCTQNWQGNKAEAEFSIGRALGSGACVPPAFRDAATLTSVTYVY